MCVCIRPLGNMFWLFVFNVEQSSGWCLFMAIELALKDSYYLLNTLMKAEKLKALRQSCERF